PNEAGGQGGCTLPGVRARQRHFRISGERLPPGKQCRPAGGVDGRPPPAPSSRSPPARLGPAMQMGEPVLRKRDPLLGGLFRGSRRGTPAASWPCRPARGQIVGLLFHLELGVDHVILALAVAARAAAARAAATRTAGARPFASSLAPEVLGHGVGGLLKL